MAEQEAYVQTSVAPGVFAGRESRHGGPPGAGGATRETVLALKPVAPGVPAGRESRHGRPPGAGGATRGRGAGCRRWVGAAMLLWLCLPSVGMAELEVPFLSGRVSDLAEVLSPGSERRIEETLSGLEEVTGAQVVVLTIGSLEGEDLEDYSLRVAETWQTRRRAMPYTSCERSARSHPNASCGSYRRRRRTLSSLRAARPTRVQ